MSDGTRLGRLIRDIRRKIDGQEHTAAVFEAPLCVPKIRFDVDAGNGRGKLAT